MDIDKHISEKNSSSKNLIKRISKKIISNDNLLRIKYNYNSIWLHLLGKSIIKGT